MAGRIVDVTIRLIDKVTSPLAGVNKNITQSAKQWQKSGREIVNAGKAISDVGSSLTKNVTVPLVGMAGACVKVATDFEAGMSKVQSIAGEVASGELSEITKVAEEMGLEIKKGANDTETAMNILSEKAKQMGAQTKFSATEATDAFSYMAMAGWKTKEMMEGIEGVMYLAGATGEDLAQTSDIVTDALTAFGMTASDTTRFVDVLAQTANNTNTDVAMLGESFQYCAPVAGALKYSVEDTAVALGLMANSGIKASNAGTAMRSWLSRMASPTKQVATAMSELGIELTNSDGSMKSLATVMSDTRGAFSKLTETEKAHYASVLAGKTGMSGLLAVVNSADSDFDKVTEAINNSTGACKEMYDVANDNLQGQLTILKSTLESLAISFGEIMLPKVKALVTWLQKLAEKFNSLTTKQKENVLKWGAIIASIGPVLLIFGKLVMTVGKVYLAIGKFGSLLRSFGSLGAVIASPAGIVIGVIAGIAIAVALIIKNWDKLKPYFEKVKVWFTNIFSKIREVVMTYLPPAIDKLKSWLGSTFTKIKDIIMRYLPPAIEKLKEAFAKSLPVIQGIIQKVVAKVTPVIKAIITEMNRLIPIIKDKLTKAFNIALPVMKKYIAVGVDIGKKLLSAIKSAWQSIKPVLSALGEMFGVIFDWIVKKASKMYADVKPTISALVDKFLEISKKVAPYINIALDVMGKGIKTFIDIARISFEGLMGVFKGIITFITGVFSGDWKKAWEGVKEIFSSIFSTFAELAKKPINAVISIINGAIEKLNSIKVTVPAWVPHYGGKSWGINIPKIPTLAKGTDNWKGGIVQISEKGGEIVDLPQGSRVYPHDESVKKAYSDGARAGGTKITIAKLADQIVVREDADIDKIAQKLAQKLEEVSKNLGGGELGYLY